jgi:ppGpp synthetase/RelA/SpoT-type nucleotidyltranferase
MRKFSNNSVNKAGATLKETHPDSILKVNAAEDILTYWRFIHTPILNTFQSTLRTKLSGKYKKQGFIAQRLKRSSSIISKLRREPNMKLSTMQDIAGIRAVMNNLKDVFTLSNELKKSRAKHKIINEFDYINNPKKSGYRSIHLIFQYDNLKNQESNGLKIEVQVRTRLQHIWATTVETLGTFMETSLKSSEGPEKILEFLSLTSSAFALMEKTPLISEHLLLSNEEIYKNVIQEYSKLNIEDKLQGFTVAAKHIDNKFANSKYHYYLIQLDLQKRMANIRQYKFSELDKANEDYTKIERTISLGEPLQVVLVSTDKISALSKAYPNYFLDTKDFIKEIEKIKGKLEFKN